MSDVFEEVTLELQMTPEIMKWLISQTSHAITKQYTAEQEVRKQR